MDVKFTDIDYKIYTDAAEQILKGDSPYDRHTYRYSPLVYVYPSVATNTNSNSMRNRNSSRSNRVYCVFCFRAYLCIPNLLGCPFFGKLIFCCMDMAIALLIEVRA